MDTENIDPKYSFLILTLVVITETLFTYYLRSDMLVFTLFRLFQIAMILSIVYILYRNFESIGLTRVVKGFFKGVIWSLAFGLIVLIAGVVIYLLDHNPFSLFRVQLPSSGLKLVLYFLSICLIAPIYEEIVFRGVLYRLLRKRGVIVAVIASSAIFSLVHMINGGISIVNIVGGVLFAISFEIEKNLITPITIHFAGNASIFLLGYLGS